MSHELLSQLPLFSGLSQADLSLLEAASQQVGLDPGDVLMTEGSPGGSLYVILEGQFEISKRSASHDLVIAVRGPGEVIGEMSLLDGSPRTATVRALDLSRVLEIDQQAFRRLIESSPAATLSILHTVTSRLRHTESMLRQSENLASLGTLAAGLAHELNNPASALKRAAAQVRELLPRWQEAHARLHRAGVDETAHPGLRSMALPTRTAPALDLDPLARSDLEARMQDWLEERGLDRAWEVAPALIAAGVTVEALAEATQTLTDPALAAAVDWVSAGRMMAQLLEEVALSSDRISQIVGSVRSYTYLGQAPAQQIDLHRGLDDTLVILRSKLEPGVNVHREYASDLPSIEAYGGELNQAWTNLIANAAEAMEGRGNLHLRTGTDGDRVFVEICDDGPGIPPEVQARLFTPFFTTKPPGEGTGLGLHMTYNIITLHHGGQIAVDSRPGQTCFRVLLPTRIQRGPA